MDLVPIEKYLNGILYGIYTDWYNFKCLAQ